MSDSMHASSSLPHIVISASAGSGKTYQLVRRYLHLMALGVPPPKIAAMTFTRKASGEFFNRILNRLADLAKGRLDPDKFFAGLTPKITHMPDFAKLLRETTQTMQQLRLGTMDSFFANVCACFPLELGLPLGASVMAEDDAESAREESLAGMIERLFLSDDTDAESAIIEAYKQATFGTEEKRAADSLNQWIEDGHDRWIESDGDAAWGNPARIWPAHAIVRAVTVDWPAAVAALDSAVDANQVFTEKGAAAWQELMEELPLVEPGKKPGKRVESLLSACSRVWPDLQKGKATLTFASNKREFSGVAARALVTVCEMLVARELLVRCHRTQGTARMLSRYEHEYARRVRAQGRLSFFDVQRLLASAADAWLSAGGGDSLWYRLDRRYEHWLFDEFQDTSFQQWHVVSGLVNEVLQSDAGTRSFFAVGDPKQSIYLWRQAEPRLFEELLARKEVSVDHLFESRRSAQQVLEAANLVFAEAHVRSVLPRAGVHWRFKEHVSKTDLQGHAALLWPKTVESGDQPGAPDVMLEVLREINPPGRGLSCAVLVRSNDTARELADLIRAKLGMETVCESEQQPATDNPVTLALLSILQLAAHPGDTFALEHLRMTPLKVSDWFATMHETLRVVQDAGFTGFVKLWTGRVRQALPEMDAFTARRLDQFGDLAAEFDADGSRDIDAFINFAKASRLRTRGVTSAIQVMTVHASKGLEFDVVLLPELSPQQSMHTLKPRPFIVRRDAEGRLRWVLQEPPRDLVDFDETLSVERAEAEERTEFESLCRLYVAMTRAKRGLYMILEKPPGDKAKSVNEARVLRSALGDTAAREDQLGGVAVEFGWECGSRRWFAGDQLQPQPEARPQPVRAPLGELLRARQPLPQRRTPSGEESFKTKGKVLWSTARDPGRQLGSLVHKMLEQIEWTDARFDVSSLMPRWETLGLAQERSFDLALEHVQRAVASGALAKPATKARLWRERPFDLMLPNGQWISGTIDRVVIECDANGAPQNARIIDFKTDDVTDEAAMNEKLEGYAPQIALYRQAAARLTGLDAAQVTAELVFTRTGQTGTL